MSTKDVLPANVHLDIEGEVSIIGEITTNIQQKPDDTNDYTIYSHHASKESIEAFVSGLEEYTQSYKDHTSKKMNKQIKGIRRKDNNMAKYYAVKTGKTPGIYTSWDYCKANVHGVPGAVYKSFLTQEEAEEYMGSTGSKGKVASNNDLNIQADTAVAYVDGSFDSKTNRFSYGCFIKYAGEEIKLCKAMDDENLVGMRNVAGEIKGSEEAIKYCITRGIKKVVIVHDYEGVSRWVTGEWAAKKVGTQEYRDLCKSVSDLIELSFICVKGHTGDLGNEEADRLAKEALGIKK